MNEKSAVLSMDVEDWYHLNYFQGKSLDLDVSMLDGFYNYIELLNRHHIKTTFFVLSELAGIAKEQIRYASSCGHEIACHGKTHMCPLNMNIKEFEQEITEAKNVLGNLVGKEVIGYRAPCYSIDDERYSILIKVGFKYSSSKMDVPDHPLYGCLKLAGFEQPVKGIYYKDGMTEFALPTENFLGQAIAVSGGGWIRLFPWNTFMKPMIKKYLKNAATYTLYIHPFELSHQKMPQVPDVSILTRLRARGGLGKVDGHIEEIIKMLGERGFLFHTFADLAASLQIKSENRKMYGNEL